MPKVVQLFDVVMRRSRKEKLKEKGRLGRVEQKFWAAVSRNKNASEKEVFAKANLRVLEFLFLLQGSSKV